MDQSSLLNRTRLRIEGTTRRVSVVDANKPPDMAIPSGCMTFDPAPKPIATGSIPTMVVSDVITIGRNRFRAVSIKASIRFS